MTFIYDEKTMNTIRIIEKHIHWILDIKETSTLLKRSERTIYRMKLAFKTLGPPWLLHWLKWKPSNHQGDATKYGDIRTIFRKNPKYHDFWPTLIREHLALDFGVNTPKETLRQIMIKEGIWVAKPQRRRIKHQKRRRRACYGGLVQFDGSYHDWFENWEKPCLLCAVDDATSKVYAHFSKWESFEEVFEFWKSYFKKFGKPQAIYVDRHATYKVNAPKDRWWEEKLTRFKVGMAKLGVEVIYANSPEAKGRVEKGNATHQDRLVKKMRLLGIKSRESANQYLERSYLKEHNNRFEVAAHKEWDKHQALNKDEEENLERYFAKTNIRTVKNDGTIQYKHKIYQLPKGLVLKSRSILVKESTYGNVKFFDWTDCLQCTTQP